jgi:hypothetical protein
VGRWGVRLTDDQIQDAIDLGHKRQLGNWNAGRTSSYGASNEWSVGLRYHICGCLGEMAYWVWCILLGKTLEWNYFDEEYLKKGARPIKKPDFKPDIDTKWAGEPGHKLIIGANENDFWRYLLVDGTNHPLYEMAGWYYGREAKRPMWQKDEYIDRDGARRKGGSFFVPREALRQMTEWTFDNPWLGARI